MPETFRFAEYSLNRARYELLRSGEPVSIEPRAFDVLRVLLEHRERVVGKAELFDKVWGTTYVSDAALTTALRTVRRAIGDSGAQQSMIRTVHGRGYQFVASVEIAEVPAISVPSTPDAVASSPLPAPQVRREEAAAIAREQDVRYCSGADGVSIAYATVGSGPPLLKAANWITHLNLELDSPVWAHWIADLAKGRTLVRYDERGCGMSELDVNDFTFEDWVADLETVVDHAGLETFPLLGVSQGAAVAIAYAARHPERVSRLVLAGGYAQGRLVRARTQEQRSAAALDLELARVGWAREDTSFLRVFASQFLPDGTQAEWDEFTRFQQRTTSPDNAVRFLEQFAQIDVVDEAPLVQCPTLILHSRDDVRVPGSQARKLAALIPDSRLVMLDSRSHLLGAHEPAWQEFRAHVDAFLADASHPS